MGKATRWLKGLLGMKLKDKENVQSPNSAASSDRKDKKRWSFGAKSERRTSAVGSVPTNLASNLSPSYAAWLRTYLAESEKEQNKHAIAVAAATAAAADAAVAAAQAAVAVVRLTSQGGVMLNGKRESAAVKIQTCFRGYLIIEIGNVGSNKSSKGFWLWGSTYLATYFYVWCQRLWKIGFPNLNMARKALRALKGLVKIQALVRGYLVRKRAAATLHSMQALIRAQTAVRTQRARRSFNKENRWLPEFHSRKSMERFDESRSEFHSKRLCTTYEASLNGFEESPKIVEIDTYKPRSRSRRFSTALSECSEDMPYQTISSPLPCPVPARISVPHCQQLQDFEWCINGQECRFSTAHNTPRFSNPYWSNGAPTTPAKSVCGDSFFRPYSNYPNYMANTQSFNAKLRSHSAPKQRPEPGPKKRLSLNEMMESRNSISSVRMHRSYGQVQEDEEEAS